MAKDIRWKTLKRAVSSRRVVGRRSKIPLDHICPRCGVHKLKERQWLKYRGICRTCGSEKRYVTPRDIRGFRLSMHLTQVEAARRCRWSQVLQSYYETGYERMTEERFEIYVARLRQKE